MSPSETLLREIRTTKPSAPPALRERVRELARQAPEPEPWWRRLSPRRFLLVAAPVTAALALGSATVIGLTQDGAVGGGADEAVSSEPLLERASPAQQDSAASGPAAGGSAEGSAPPSAGALAPTPGRLQRYDAQLSLRVEDVEELSAATQQAMRIARSLGGTVASVSYDSGSSEVGTAQLTLRVPIARVQQAVVQLSALGTILGQRYGIEDLQPAADDLARQIEETQARIAQLQSTLTNASLTPSEAAVLRARLAEARRQLTDLRSARLATVQLSLTTEELLAAPAERGALDRVVDILRWEAVALLYALVVVGPFALLALAVWALLRVRRRREERRLLAQS